MYFLPKLQDNLQLKTLQVNRLQKNKIDVLGCWAVLSVTLRSRPKVKKRVFAMVYHRLHSSLFLIILSQKCIIICGHVDGDGIIKQVRWDKETPHSIMSLNYLTSAINILFRILNFVGLNLCFSQLY